MDPTEYARIPETLEVRLIRFTIRESGHRTREIEIVTTARHSGSNASWIMRTAATSPGLLAAASASRPATAAAH
jgi:hypothetical protein